jgi:hypothetical protein
MLKSAKVEVEKCPTSAADLEIKCPKVGHFICGGIARNPLHDQEGRL